MRFLLYFGFARCVFFPLFRLKLAHRTTRYVQDHHHAPWRIFKRHSLPAISGASSFIYLRYGPLLRTTSSSDITFCLQGQVEIPAHKAIISARCPALLSVVFNCCFSHLLPCSNVCLPCVACAGYGGRRLCVCARC